MNGDDSFRIRFISEAGFVSAAIRDVTDSQWSHVDIILPDGFYLGARSNGGVQVRPPNYCKPIRERRYAIPTTPDQLDAMLTFARAQIGKPYDFLDIAGLLAHRDWRRPNAWMCSELAAATAEAGNMPMLNAEAQFVNHITPEMLHLSPLLIGHCYMETATAASDGN